MAEMITDQLSLTGIRTIDDIEEELIDRLDLDHG
jgi:hypothetical protein